MLPFYFLELGDEPAKEREDTAEITEMSDSQLLKNYTENKGRHNKL